MSESPVPQSRRKLLKSIALGGGAIAVAKTLPESWTKPVIDSMMLPAHGWASLDAGQYLFRFTGVAETDETFPTGVSDGDTLIIDVVVNNGNASLVSQTWAYTDVVSITFRAGSTYSAVVDPQLGTAGDARGGFTTNASGNLTAFPDDWDQDNTEPGSGQNDSNGTEIVAWFLNDANDILYLAPWSDIAVGSVSEGIDDLSKWSIVP